MNYEIIYKGRIKSRYNTLFQEYIKRVNASVKCFQSWPSLQKYLEGKSYIILSEKGSQLNSLEFFGFIRKQAESGTIRFVLGDEKGFPKGILENAFYSLSLSSMTLPHDLAKIILLEQLYRSECILKNKEYHR